MPNSRTYSSDRPGHVFLPRPGPRPGPGAGDGAGDFQYKKYGTYLYKEYISHIVTEYYYAKLYRHISYIILQ